jgi:adenylate cyclase
LTYGGRWWQAGGFSLVWLGVPILAGFAAYAKGQWWPVAAHETASALSLVGALAMNYWAEGRQKAFIKQAFRHYLSGDVIEKILRDPDHLQLGGEKRELTIMFTDLAGFSTFSERLGPVELTALLNDYLTEMTDIIMDEGGTLDKYEGDAIIAFWNAPLEQSDHATRACRAALRCQRRLAELRETFEKRTGAALHMRVGLNTGDVVVGNMGSRKRFNYTILGDAANLASRLEGANKAFGTEIMVAESTWQQVSGAFRGRPLADLRVVGRKTAVAVYELTGFAAEPEPAAWSTFTTGRTHFREGNFAAAKEAFEQLPDDPAAQHYARRCESLCGNRPEAWDGVWNLTEK